MESYQNGKSKFKVQGEDIIDQRTNDKVKKKKEY